MQWNHINRATAFLSGNQLSAAILASDVAGSTAGTTYGVTVTNPTPNAGISVPVNFTIVNPVPVLLSLSPTSGYGNTAGLLITLNGKSLASGALTFGSNALSFQYINAGTVTFNLPPTAAYGSVEYGRMPPGPYDVTYSNPAPGGGNSNALTFTVLPTDAPVNSNILGGNPYLYRLKAASRDMRFVIGTEHYAKFGASSPLMSDTCNDAPPGCTISSSVDYSFTDAGTSAFTLSAALSRDGRFAVFEGGPYEYPQRAVYERDTCLGLSAPPGCVPESILICDYNYIYQDSTDVRPAVSGDGRFVAFTARGNIDPSDVNGLDDVYLRDTCVGATLCTPTTTLISQAAANITADQPVVSPTGRFVGYRTAISGSSPQLALYDTCFGASGCTPATFAITDPATVYAAVKFGGISVSGRYVSYSAGTTPQTQQVYVHDTCIDAGAAGCVPSDVLVSVSTDGSAGDNGSINSVMSYDGRYIAFDSNATNLVTHDTNSATDVFWRDTCNGAPPGCSPRTVRVSADSNGVQMLGANVVQISADGQEVALTDGVQTTFFAKGPF